MPVNENYPGANGSSRGSCVKNHRIVVTREGETDVMTLRAEIATQDATLQQAVTATLRAVTKLGGTVDLDSTGSLPNDGKVIVDERG